MAHHTKRRDLHASAAGFVERNVSHRSRRFLVLSAILTLTVQIGAVAQPVILFEPADQRVRQGMQFALSVEADGIGSLSFRWYHDGDPIPSATNSIFVIPSIQPADAGGYRVIVSNNSGSITSRIARLTVRPTAPPATVVAVG
jgi:Ig-like domain-containing protein